MKRLSILGIAGLAALLILSGCGGGGGGGASGGTSLSGTVVAAGTLSPLSGVQVAVVETGKTTTTDANGRFTLTGLSAGTYTLRFTKAGYEQRDRPIAVTEGTNPDLDAIWLTPSNADEPPGQGLPYDIEGKVQLAGATDFSGVKAELLEGTTVVDTLAATPSTGVYTFWAYAGTFTVRLTKTGYTTITIPVTVQDQNAVVQLSTVTLQKQ